MTILLTSTVVVLGPSAADNNACAGTMLPIKLFHRECRPLQPWKLTQIAAHSSRAPAAAARTFYPYTGELCKSGYQLGWGNCRRTDGRMVAVLREQCVSMDGTVELHFEGG